MKKQVLRQAMIQYIAGFYAERKRVPSVRETINHFKTSFTCFYEGFSGGLSEACRLAGVPVPEERIKRTQKAVESSKTVEETRSEYSLGSMVLSEEQTKRFWGISHLEGGKDPLLQSSERRFSEPGRSNRRDVHLSPGLIL